MESQPTSERERDVGIWARIEKMDRRIMIWALVLTTALAGIFPVPLPIAVSEPARRAYSIIDALQPGDLVLMAPDFQAGSWASCGPSGTAILKHMQVKGAKVVFLSGYRPDAAPLADQLVKNAGLDNKKYGEDYVQLGYVPGEETFVAAIAKDFRANVKTDVHGTSIDQIPILQNVDDPGDFKLVVCLASSETPVWWIRQWNIPFGVQIITANTGATVGGILAWYPDKGVSAYLDDAAGAGQYEYISGFPGAATRLLGMQNITHLWVILWIVLGNIAYLAQKNGGNR
jgi:hypothetical protein